MVIYHIKTLLSHLYQAESGARGYLILKDDHQLENFYSNTRQIDSLIKSIQVLIKDNGLQETRGDTIRQLVQERLGRLYDTVLMFKEKKLITPDEIGQR